MTPHFYKHLHSLESNVTHWQIVAAEAVHHLYQLCALTPSQLFSGLLYNSSPVKYTKHRIFFSEKKNICRVIGVNQTWRDFGKPFTANNYSETSNICSILFFVSAKFGPCDRVLVKSDQLTATVISSLFLFISFTEPSVSWSHQWVSWILVCSPLAEHSQLSTWGASHPGTTFNSHMRWLTRFVYCLKVMGN